MNSTAQFSARKEPGIAGKVFATLFFGVFLGMGCFFTALIGRSFWSVLETYRWTQADAQIVTSSARPRPDGGARGYEFAVEYRYDSGRDWLAGTRWSTKEPTFERFDEAQRLADRFRPGAQVRCWRDPNDAHAVVLERQSPLFGLVVLFPLIFVGVGAGGIWAIWRRWKPGERLDERPVSERARPRVTSVAWVRFFFLIFFVVGAGVLWVLTIGPLLEILAARAWVATPASVLSSRVVAQSDSDGNSYRVDILYAYTFDGAPRQSSRYDFSRGSSSGYGTKAAIVQNYPVGAETTCYVNPRDPSEAVLRREPFKALGFGAIGFVFLGLGAFGMAGARKLSGAAQPARLDGLPATAVEPAPAGSVVLQPQQSRVGKFVFILIFAVIWNALIGFFVHLTMVRDPQTPLFAKVIVGVLALCGVGLICSVFYQCLALFNPVVRLVASAQSIPLGRDLRLEWTVEGRASRLRRLRITLEGREEATYRRGTHTYTDRNVFIRFALLDTADRAEIETGHKSFPIPAGAMHTFEGRHNKVVWRLHIAGEVPRWPDIDDEYPMTLLPQELKS